MPHKRVILLLIDGLSWRVIEPALRNGSLPFLAALAERGSAQACVSIFPSITPAATGSIISGVGPREHKVQGAFWYDPRFDDVEYFGGAPRVMLREGLSTVVDDFVQTLNDELLAAPTLFELAADSGLSAANLNLMWRRGPIRHDLDAPLLLKLLPGVSWAPHVSGPDQLMLGDFVSLKAIAGQTAEYPGGPLHRFGFNDEATLSHLAALAGTDQQSDITVAYCPDNDFDSHKRGPQTALETVQKVDEAMRRIADEMGGIDAWLADTAFVVVGDHGHDDLAKDAERRDVSLEDLFADETIATAGESWENDESLYVCPNMRAAQICIRSNAESEFRRLAAKALTDDRIDQAIWNSAADDLEHSEFYVQTRERGELRFRCVENAGDVSVPEADEPERHAVDQNGRGWALRGSLEAIDARLDGDRRIEYGEYPDALSRIADGSAALPGSLWLTARPGSQFYVPGSERHEGGSHGSLHRCDSETVLITAGTPAPASAPASITDVVDMCLGALGAQRPTRSLAGSR